MLVTHIKPLYCKRQDKTHGRSCIAITLWSDVMQGVAGQALFRQMGVNRRHTELPRGKGFGATVLPTALLFQPVLRFLHAGNAFPQPRYQGFGVQSFF
jgi:hypothetical protein